MSYSPEWTTAPVILGALLLLIIPPFALIAVAVVAVVAVAALVALAAAILASPYLLGRRLQRHLAERRQSAEGPAPMARPVAVSRPLAS